MIIFLVLENQFEMVERTNTLSTLKDRLEIIKYIDESPDANHTAVAKHFHGIFHKNILRKAIEYIKEHVQNFLDLLDVHPLKSKSTNIAIKFGPINQRLTRWCDDL